MDGGAWWAAVHGVTKSWTRLSDFTFTFHFHALEKEMAAHSSVLAWRIPGMGEAGGLLSMGSHRVEHDYSNLAVSSMQFLLYSSWGKRKVLTTLTSNLTFCSMKILQGSIMGTWYSIDKRHSGKHHWISTMFVVLHFGWPLDYPGKFLKNSDDVILGFSSQRFWFNWFRMNFRDWYFQKGAWGF